MHRHKSEEIIGRDSSTAASACCRFGDMTRQLPRIAKTEANAVLHGLAGLCDIVPTREDILYGGTDFAFCQQLMRDGTCERRSGLEYLLVAATLRAAGA